MPRLAQRIDRVTAIMAGHLARKRAENLAGLANFFLVNGDPRENPTFADLTPDEQVALVWHFDAWCAGPSGFLTGEAPEDCRPTHEQFDALRRTMWRGCTVAWEDL